MNKSKALREDNYRRIFEMSATAMILSARNNQIIEVNPAACRLFGYPYQEFLKLSFEDICHPDELQMTKELRKQLFEKGEGIKIEKKYIARNGRIIHAMVNVNPIHLLNNRPA